MTIGVSSEKPDRLPDAVEFLITGGREMERRRIDALVALVFVLWLFGTTTGCQHIRNKRAVYNPPPPPAPLGSVIDQINQTQETNAEASDFVVHQHEFTLGTRQLNMAGKDHVKELAQRILAGQPFPVIIERSMTTARQDTAYQFPIHPNPELDMQRREVIVRSLTAMGVVDADQRVVVAPALAPGFTGAEAERTYQQGFSDFFNSFGGFGFGAFNGFGGFGGF
jgi:hypothetical protein